MKIGKENILKGILGNKRYNDEGQWLLNPQNSSLPCCILVVYFYVHVIRDFASCDFLNNLIF